MSFAELTLTQVATHCKRSSYAVALWLKSGKLKGHKVGKGPRAEWRVTEDDLLKFFSENPRIARAFLSAEVSK
ncbi:MAG: helix-turn-helix domain-containing protein [Candidatus Ozemobacteraceae bacterium]